MLRRPAFQKLGKHFAHAKEEPSPFFCTRAKHAVYYAIERDPNKDGVIHIKEMRTLKNYRFGVSIAGIAAVVLVMLPNLAYLFLLPPTDPLAGNAAGHFLPDLLENIGRIGMMAALCVLVNRAAPPLGRPLAIALACLLIAYYALWIAYFAGAHSGLSLTLMAVLPSAFFLLTAYGLRNGVALGFASLFAALHIVITARNFLF